MSRITQAVASVGLAAAVAAAIVSPAQAAVPAPVVGATAVTQVGYTYQDGWARQEGKFKTRVAVAISGGVTHMLGVGLNGYLYHRTASTPWHRIVPDTFKCKDVVAAANGGVVHVGCTGLNNALYTFTFDAATSTPFVSAGWVKADGMTVQGAITAYPTGDSVLFEVTGDEFIGEDGGVYNQWYWNGTTWGSDDLNCSTTSAWTQDPSAPWDVIVACGVTHNDGSRAIWVQTSGFAGEIPGATTEAPAVVIVDDTTSRIFVQGTNGRLYSQDVVDGDLTGTWTNHGGQIQYGVTAATSYVPTLPAGVARP